MYFAVGGFFRRGFFCFGARLALSILVPQRTTSPLKVQNRVDFLCESAD
jgi:hypothetical protein